MIDALIGTALVVLLILTLSAIVISARALLLPSEPVLIVVNGRREIAATTGDKLLGALGSGGVILPAACGGSGTCGQCKVQLTDGLTQALPTETALLQRGEIRSGVRLACQVALRTDLSVSIPDELLAVQEWAVTVVSNRALAPMVREVVLQLPDGQQMNFVAGQFVMVTAPAYIRAFADLEIAAEHRAIWDALGINGLVSTSHQPATRAYSVANLVVDGRREIVLLIRLALPPPSAHGAPPGVVSSYLFGARAGDKLRLSGPFGDFVVRPGNSELILIGGGVGMAPLRAIISEQLAGQKSSRRVSFWYGARSRVELYCGEDLDHLQATHANFNWTVALSDPAAEDQWQGATGFIHDVLEQRYLRDHPAIDDCEFYLCGPPLMIKATQAMLNALGVSIKQIFNDDFGA